MRFSSQSYDLPASDSGLRMSSSRIAPPPPVSVETYDQNKKSSKYSKMGDYAPSSYAPLERSSGAYGSRTSLLNIQVFLRVIANIIFVSTITVTIIVIVTIKMIPRKPQSQRATCNRPPPLLTSATLAWQVSLILEGESYDLDIGGEFVDLDGDGDDSDQIPWHGKCR